VTPTTVATTPPPPPPVVVEDAGDPRAPVAIGEAPLPAPLAAIGETVVWGTSAKLMADARALADVTTLSGAAIEGDFVYYAETEPGTVSKIPLAGGSPVVIARGQAGPRDVKVKAGFVYWANHRGGTVARAPIGGGEAQVIAHGQKRPRGLALDDQSAYWADDVYETLVKSPLAGGGRQALGKEDDLADMTADATGLYFTRAERGEVVRFKSGMKVLASKEEMPTALAVDATHLYWGCSKTGTLRRMPKEGGAVETLASGQGVIGAIAPTGRYIFWSAASQSRLMRMPR
jgi:hypothetical protein